jgi:uncharacterized spore protein YtfJ
MVVEGGKVEIGCGAGVGVEVAVGAGVGAGSRVDVGELAVIAVAGAHAVKRLATSTDPSPEAWS